MPQISAGSVLADVDHEQWRRMFEGVDVGVVAGQLDQRVRRSRRARLPLFTLGGSHPIDHVREY